MSSFFHIWFVIKSKVKQAQEKLYVNRGYLGYDVMEVARKPSPISHTMPSTDIYTGQADCQDILSGYTHKRFWLSLCLTFRKA